MYSKEGVVYKLHAGWFTDAPQGSLQIAVILLNLEVLSVEILQKEGKVKN